MDMQQTATRATNTGLYQLVDDALPDVLPAITREEAQRANELLCRHFGKVSMGPVTMLKVVAPRFTRRCWLSSEPTRGTNHRKGWGRLIHDVSHRIFRRRHPHFRPHAGGHATLEREIAQYVIAKGWLEGSLIKRKLKVSRNEKRTVILKRTEACLARWESKYARAGNAIKKLKRRYAALKRREQLSASSALGSP
jgi:hypothetical protein